MKEFKVADRYRSGLSQMPGGYIIKIYFNNGEVREYDKVKDPISYLRKALKDSNIVDYEIIEPIIIR